MPLTDRARWAMDRVTGDWMMTDAAAKRAAEVSMKLLAVREAIGPMALDQELFDILKTARGKVQALQRTRRARLRRLETSAARRMEAT